MLQIIAPQQFRTIPWKNGLGETTELAINEGGNLECFDWRLSIASVINDGVFSDFSGYQRNLVLISGHGLMLQHDDKSSDNLTNLLDMASFDGACKTYGKLIDGAIKDFNIITNKQRILSQVSCYVDEQKVEIQLAELSFYFAYSLTGKISIEVNGQENTIVPQGHLVKISSDNGIAHKADSMVKLCSKNMILVKLQQRESYTK